MDKVWHPNSFSFRSFTPPSFTSASFSAPLPSAHSLASTQGNQMLEAEIVKLRAIISSKDDQIAKLENTITQLKGSQVDQNTRSIDNNVISYACNIYLGFFC